MRLTKTRSRIAALAGAAALVASWGAVSAPAAQAATDFTVVNDSTGLCVVGLGAAKAVTLSSNTGDCTEFTAVNPYHAMGVDWWEYKAAGNLCLQANTEGTTVTEGGCEKEQGRQLWHWPETKGAGPLQNLYSSYFAYESETAMDLTTSSSYYGSLEQWQEP
jgi:hypothetical protein